MAVLAALLMGVWWLTGRARGVAAGAGAGRRRSTVIAKRVEALRGLRFESLPRPVEVTPGAGAARGAGGPRPLLPRGAPARRRAGAQAARADRRLGGPARRVRLGVLRGRRGLLRPAHEADAHRARRGHGHAACWRRWCSRTSSRTRSRTSATGSASRTRAAATTRRSRGSRSSRAAPPTLMYAYARAPLHGRGDARRGARERVRRRPARCPAFLQAQLVFPYTGGAGVRRRAARARGRPLDARGPRGALAPAGLDRAGHAPGEVGAGRAAACRVRVRAGEALGDGWERAAGGVLGEFQTRELLAARGRRRLRRRPRRAGAGTATSSGAAAGPRLRVAVPARRGADRALALGHAAPTRASSRPSCASGCADGLGARRRTAGPSGSTRARGRRGPRRRGDAGDGAVRAAGAAARGRALSCRRTSTAAGWGGGEAGGAAFRAVRAARNRLCGNRG